MTLTEARSPVPPSDRPKGQSSRMRSPPPSAPAAGGARAVPQRMRNAGGGRARLRLWGVRPGGVAEVAPNGFEVRLPSQCLILCLCACLVAWPCGACLLALPAIIPTDLLPSL